MKVICNKCIVIVFFLVIFLTGCDLLFPEFMTVNVDIRLNYNRPVGKYQLTLLSSNTDGEEYINSWKVAGNKSDDVLHKYNTGEYIIKITTIDSSGVFIGYGEQEFTISDERDVYTINFILKEFITPPVSDQEIINYIWSPDGTEIAYVVSQNGNTANCDLWIADSNLKNNRKIKEGEVSIVCGWQDGIIVFLKDRENTESAPEYYGGGEIWKINPDGSGEKQITYTFKNGIRTDFHNQGYLNIGTVKWARLVPGSDMLYFKAHNGNGWYRTFACKNDGSNMWDDISRYDLAWLSAISPTGNKVFYSKSENHGEPQTLIACNIDRTNKQVIKGPLPWYTPVICLSDGKRILFYSDNFISVINIDGTDEQKIYNDRGFSTYLSSHGRNGSEALICTTINDGNFHVYSLDINTGTVTPMTVDSQYSEFNPSFSPDGSKLAYLRQSPERSNCYKLFIDPVTIATPIPPEMTDEPTNEPTVEPTSAPSCHPTPVPTEKPSI